MAKRLKKRQIKEDKFQTNILKASDWLQKNAKSVTTAGLVVVVIVVAFIFALGQSRRARAASAGTLSEAVLYMVAGQTDNAVDLFNQLRADYHGTESERWGSLQLANIYLARGLVPEAREVFVDLANDPPDDPLARAASLSGVAACDEAMGMHTAAAEGYESAAAVNGSSVTAADCLVAAARNWRAAAQPERARAAYERIVEEFPDYSDLDRVMTRLAQLPT
jgi:tetratricopeptide (TPR) repeat protein